MQNQFKFNVLIQIHRGFKLNRVFHVFGQFEGFNLFGFVHKEMGILVIILRISSRFKSPFLVVTF